MNKKINTNKIKTNKFLFGFIFFLFIVLIGRLVFLCLVDFKVGEVTISEFTKNRNTENEIIMPSRGNIYDSSNTILAQDVASYTVIAYLSEKRSEGSDKILHVVDKEDTANKLSPLINMSASEILALLNKEDVYQVELGPGGRNLSQLEMENIKALEIPGIDFIKSLKRYYPNGDYASYTLGYTVKKEDEDNLEWITGELGVEKYYDEVLRGNVGYIEYEKDKYGYKIPNGREYVEEANNGDDIYLTIDNNIQLFVESALKSISQTSEAEWALMMVADAKTGAILANSSTPSFDPNIRNMTSYLNPFVSYAYEPGSTMKIFTYMCAIEKGVYKGDDTYLSGSKSYVDQTDKSKISTISDWNKRGWGSISYDLGFALSSNTAIANLLESYINKDDLLECFQKYGFGKTTGFTMNNELKGNLDFYYPIEVAAAGYGQGITTTPIQHIQALTAIANNGEMLKPYIVSKIVDSDTGKTTYQAKREVVDTVASVETINKIKNLMGDVINNPSHLGTGYSYKIEGIDLIGKTGTAQIYDYKLGKYLDEHIYSVSLMYPKEEPEIIIYVALSRPKDAINYIATPTKEVIKNINNYLNIDNSILESKNNSVKLVSYANKNREKVVEELQDYGLNVVVLGNGDKIIKQYPSADSYVYTNDKVFLLTNNYEKEMINVFDYSYKEVINLFNLMDINYQLEGNGYVVSQSIGEGVKINQEDMVYITLKEKYKEENIDDS